MFENTPPNLPTAKEPEDIFSPGQKPASPSGPAPSGPPRPVVPTPGAPPPASRPGALPGVPAGAPPRPILSPPAVPPSSPSRPERPAASLVEPSRGAPPAVLERPSRSWIRVLFILVALGAVGAGTYLVLTKLGIIGGTPAPSAPKEEESVQQPPVNQPEAPPEVPPTPAPPPPPPPPAAPVDSDGDGLTDEDEASLGTDPQKADTDGDGLLDNEEVRIYKTDPLNPDTDGDGFKDGDEVRNGYNPSGPGRLFQVPTQ